MQSMQRPPGKLQADEARRRQGADFPTLVAKRSSQPASFARQNDPGSTQRATDPSFQNAPGTARR